MPLRPRARPIDAIAVEAARARPGGGGDAAVDADLGVDARDMVAHGVAGDVERARDRLVVEPAADQRQHLALARA